LLLRAKLDRQAGPFDAAEKLLHNFPAAADISLRTSAKYELAAVLDRQGRYDEAMAACREAKALVQPLAERPIAELKIMRARVNHLSANASADVLHQWFDFAPELRPSHRVALLGGHPRSGTTLLEQVLDTHPDIVSAEGTEIFQNDGFGPLLRGHPDDIAIFVGLAKAMCLSNSSKPAGIIFAPWNCPWATQ
jgi:tetratricopeptide (TPR) repeat protein